VQNFVPAISKTKRYKTRIKLAKIHEKIKSQRNDVSKKLSPR